MSSPGHPFLLRARALFNGDLGDLFEGSANGCQAPASRRRKAISPAITRVAAAARSPKSEAGEVSPPGSLGMCVNGDSATARHSPHLPERRRDRSIPHDDALRTGQRTWEDVDALVSG
jgi:hypothetical protein